VSERDVLVCLLRRQRQLAFDLQSAMAPKTRRLKEAESLCYGRAVADLARWQGYSNALAEAEKMVAEMFDDAPTS
jgi:hypothetical protein